jgi:hypothetical protein
LGDLPFKPFKSGKTHGKYMEHTHVYNYMIIKHTHTHIYMYIYIIHDI